MKKFLVVLLILAVAGGLFAQELTWDGELKAGVRIGIPDKDMDMLAAMYAYNEDAGTGPLRFRLNGNFSLENVGVKFRFQSIGATNTKGDFVQLLELPYAFLWANGFNNMIYFMGGHIDDGTFNTMGAEDTDVGEGYGAQIQVKPIDGLNVGFGVYGLENGPFPGEAVYAGYLSYTMDGLFKFAGSVKGDGSKEAGTRSKINSWLGISLLMVPDLTAVIEAGIWDYDKTIEKVPMMFTQKVSYKLLDGKPLEVGLKAYEYMYNLQLKNDDGDRTTVDPVFVYYYGDPSKIPGALNLKGNLKFGFWVEPYVAYTIGFITPKLALKYNMNKFGGIMADDSDKDMDITLNEFTINPSVKFTLSSNANIDLGYKAFITSASGDYAKNVTIKDKVGEKWVSNFSSRIYCDFNWSF